MVWAAIRFPGNRERAKIKTIKTAIISASAMITILTSMGRLITGSPTAWFAAGTNPLIKAASPNTPLFAEFLLVPKFKIPKIFLTHNFLFCIFDPR